MAVEARHRNLFPPQILRNSQSVTNGVEANGNVIGYPIAYGVAAPSAETMFPMKCDGGLTYAPVSREPVNSLLPSFPGAANNNNNRGGGFTFTFLGEDITFQVHQQQLEIDRFVAHQIEKMRTEIDDRRKRYSRRITTAVEENIATKLKAREEEILTINIALEERVKSLCAENQIWRDLAQSNEAAANALRSNLQQVQDEQQRQARADAAADSVDDGRSCCNSNLGEEDRRELAGGEGRRNRLCRRCQREESCVLILPCRHLCLCTSCGSTLHTCPVCNAIKTASVHVNLSG